MDEPFTLDLRVAGASEAAGECRGAADQLQAAEIEHLRAAGRFVAFDGTDRLSVEGANSGGYFAVNPHTGRLERLRMHRLRFLVDGQEIEGAVAVEPGKVTALKSWPVPGRSIRRYEIDKPSGEPVTELYFGKVEVRYTWPEEDAAEQHVAAMEAHTAALRG